MATSRFFFFFNFVSQLHLKTNGINYISSVEHPLVGSIPQRFPIYLFIYFHAISQSYASTNFSSLWYQIGSSFPRCWRLNTKCKQRKQILFKKPNKERDRDRRLLQIGPRYPELMPMGGSVSCPFIDFRFCFSSPLLLPCLLWPKAGKQLPRG